MCINKYINLNNSRSLDRCRRFKDVVFKNTHISSPEVSFSTTTQRCLKKQ